MLHIIETHQGVTAMKAGKVLFEGTRDELWEALRAEGERRSHIKDEQVIV